jgi:hypothetical protein
MAKATLVADAGAAAVDPPTRPVEKIEAHSATTDASLPKSETAEPPATKPVSEATLSVRTHIEEARSAPPAGTVETATATPADSSLRLKAIWFGLLGAAGVASLLLWLMLRRSRSTAPASLITRSLDREKK